MTVNRDSLLVTPDTAGDVTVTELALMASSGVLGTSVLLNLEIVGAAPSTSSPSTSCEPG
jgi:hypothetical protein